MKRPHSAFKHIEIIRQRYVSGDTTPSIANDYGVSSNAIGALLRRHGVAMRDNVSAQRVLHPLDETAFDVLTPEACYWAGFLFADGCITHSGRRKNNPVLSLGLSAVDVAHVEKFRTFMRCSNKITRFIGAGYRHAGEFASLAFRSPRITERLRAVGMTNPSAIRTASIDLAKSRDFWRGVVDGDGYVRIKQSPLEYRTPTAIIGVVGWFPLVQQFHEFCRSIVKTESMISRASKKSKIFDCRFACRNAETIVAALYSGATVYLDRKMDSANKIMQLARQSRFATGFASISHKSKVASQPAS